MQKEGRKERLILGVDGWFVGLETAAFAGQSDEEIDRLMHMVVVGGGPTGIEYAGELHDFLIVSKQAPLPSISFVN